jgi:hypothetical protein
VRAHTHKMRMWEYADIEYLSAHHAGSKVCTCLMSLPIYASVVSVPSCSLDDITQVCTCLISLPIHASVVSVPTPQKVIAYGISRGRAGLYLEEVSRPARPRDIPYAITFWGVTDGERGEYLHGHAAQNLEALERLALVNDVVDPLHEAVRHCSVDPPPVVVACT